MGISSQISLRLDAPRSTEEQRALYLAAANACAGSVTQVEAIWTAQTCELRLTHADGRRQVLPLEPPAPARSVRRD
jgi:hypothetical protein